MHYRSGDKEIYVPNDEAIEQVLSILKFMGLIKLLHLQILMRKQFLQTFLNLNASLLHY